MESMKKRQIKDDVNVRSSVIMYTITEAKGNGDRVMVYK